MTKRELMGTAGVMEVLAELVNLARERVPTADGTGRWRWRPTGDVIKRWLGEPVEETCERCGQPLLPGSPSDPKL